MKQLILSDYEVEVLFELCIHSRQSSFPQKDATDVVNKVYDLYVEATKSKEKVFVVSKDFCYSEEDHSSDVVAVCSSESLAKEFVRVVSSTLPSESKTSYYYEEFNLI